MSERLTTDNAGRVCEKHQEYTATGVCRWCDDSEPLDPWMAPVVEVSPPDDDSIWTQFGRMP